MNETRVETPTRVRMLLEDAHEGYVSINHRLRVATGYDGIAPDAIGGDTADDFEVVPFTVEERATLADAMIGRWEAYKRSSGRD